MPCSPTRLRGCARGEVMTPNTNTAHWLQKRRRAGVDRMQAPATESGLKEAEYHRTLPPCHRDESAHSQPLCKHLFRQHCSRIAGRESCPLQQNRYRRQCCIVIGDLQVCTSLTSSKGDQSLLGLLVENPVRLHIAHNQRRSECHTVTCA